MCDLVARTGRHQQRYEDGCRLIAGCIPFKYKDSDGKKTVEVLMISSQSGPGLLFPKGGWENDEKVEEAAVREAIEEAGVRGKIMGSIGDYNFKSKTLRDEFSPEGHCKATMFALLVEEELCSWPEQSTRQRSWLTIPQVTEQCRHAWMLDALDQGFAKWLADNVYDSDNIEVGSDAAIHAADSSSPHL
ncbi:Nudix hydrolase 13 [Zostera marina]|uniref:Nudix hydrolase 13 n=1 Tax=Zostera marina TaxID=29655 RepID=A0A0K9PJA9_ZOSMR|nr:Nudix hydrolase 13 [Zostera marina]